MDKFPFTEEELRAAAVSVRNAMLEDLPEPSACEHTFSEKFESIMARLIKQERTRSVRSRFMQRVAAIFLAVLIGISAWLAVDTEARAAFIRWIRETYEEKVVYWFRGDPVLDSLPVCRPADIPDVWQEIDAVGDEAVQTVIYANSENSDDIIIFTYYLMQEGLSSQTSISGTVSDVKVNDFEGQFFFAGDSGMSNTLAWLDEKHGVGFSISANLPLSEIMPIAESISLANPTN